jgi:hypothetical protein
MTQDHGHDHSHDHGSELSEMQMRVRALESILLEKGYIKPAAIDELIETYEKRLDPETAPMSWRRHGSIPRSGSIRDCYCEGSCRDARG